MSTPNVTDEEIAAAQLRLVLDQKLGRDTPDVIRQIAALSLTRRVENRIDRPASGAVAASIQTREATDSAEGEREPAVSDVVIDLMEQLERRLGRLDEDAQRVHMLVQRAAEVSESQETRRRSDTGY
ncbi:hypothetical protein SK803_24980 [Lentzea sp. BCCO 10_0856]|uniref:Uncharacterized protein n=1 Tax=Lentzea miocenica TaxID=3095431 RepID=A0ABU4T5Q0_9PSEU|nr:hypothetical protein [Lentzea sp. BCCO 10_0856]MDX8033486.1 hypothetical protein [Lentzea sp. BCCO 10_0856]